MRLNNLDIIDLLYNGSGTPSEINLSDDYTKYDKISFQTTTQVGVSTTSVYEFDTRIFKSITSSGKLRLNNSSADVTREVDISSKSDRTLSIEYYGQRITHIRCFSKK